MRTLGPPGGRYPITRPGPGRKFLNGSSALMRHSIACPCAPRTRQNPTRLGYSCKHQQGSAASRRLRCSAP